MAPGKTTSLGLRQFAAVLHKNVILQIRSRRTTLGLGGWGSLIFQILVPVAFFSLMCIPKHYIKPYVHPTFIDPQQYDIDTTWWAGTSPYEGKPLDIALGSWQLPRVFHNALVFSFGQCVLVHHSCLLP